jgi:predicted SAM-dependent methyltransferase/rubredoxin
MIKTYFKKLIPAEVRKLRHTTYERITYYPRLFTQLGNRFECPICHWKFRELGGRSLPEYKNGKVVFDQRPLTVMCPRCEANDRERHLFLYITAETDILQKGGRVLHAAPEPNLRRLFERNPKIQYVTTDLCERDVLVNMDLTQIPHRDCSFNIVVCNHVLEHIPDDRKAAAELYRVLKPGGWAILQVPKVKEMAVTSEDSSVKSEEDRIRFFGQKDHVRIYGDDYPDRLRKVGFNVKCWNYAAKHGAAAALRYGLIVDEEIFVCSRPE